MRRAAKLPERFLPNFVNAWIFHMLTPVLPTMVNLGKIGKGVRRAAKLPEHSFPDVANARVLIFLDSWLQYEDVSKVRQV